MTRRQLFSALGLPAAMPRPIWLEAIAAARLPQVVAISDPSIHERDLTGILELRTYRSPVDALLRAAGIRTILDGRSAEGFAYLMPFESLESRQKTWARAPAIGQATSISIYARRR